VTDWSRPPVTFGRDGVLELTYRYRMGGSDVDERHRFEVLGPAAYRLTIENRLGGRWQVTSRQEYRRVAGRA
jgi:hypothetical protein